MHAYKLYKALGDGAVDSTDRYIFKPRKFKKCSPKNNIYIPVNNKCDFFLQPLHPRTISPKPDIPFGFQPG